MFTYISLGLMVAGALVYAFAGEKPGKLGLVAFAVGLYEFVYLAGR